MPQDLHSVPSASFVTTAREDWVLPCYKAYLEQVFSPADVESFWASHQLFLQDFFRFFQRKFTPGLQEDIHNAQDWSGFVDTWKNHPIAHILLKLLEWSQRTNCYIPDSASLLVKLVFDGTNYPSFAFPGMREFMVWTPDFSGIHVRSALIARGGIRLSNRRDFRREVLDLLETQQVKNALVVPQGAKGVFFLHPESNLSSREAYKIFIQSMISVMDNMQNGTLTHPDSVVVYDADDFYLAVGADKGTSTFSDEANKIAQQNHFWMDDAFASGGSFGYDHKKLGITSKGVWVCLREHLAGQGRAVSQDALRFVGIGDMSGDVFGNGLLESANVQLVAAFDHRHIFLDPNPSLEQSYRERCRLFHLPSSSWDDYDRGVLSVGGQIVSRKENMVLLSPQVQKMLACPEALSPDALIRFILKAKVDVLWMGGIGTYVRGKEESDQDVGDSSNDTVRICGADVGAMIIAEGANLGCTQQGRVEYAAKGGLMNIDAIDNGAGVNCSDHEVNLKLFFQTLKHMITPAQRHGIFEELTPFVVQHVLKMSYWQAISVSFALKYIQEMEQRSLSRPELCMTFLETKLKVKKIILSLDLETTEWKLFVQNYFPEMIREDFSLFVTQHVLYKPLLSTILANHIVNLWSPVFLKSSSTLSQEDFDIFVQNCLWMYKDFEMHRLANQIEIAKYDVSDVYRLMKIGTTLLTQTLALPQGDDVLSQKYQSLRAHLENTVTPVSEPLHKAWDAFTQEISVMIEALDEGF